MRENEHKEFEENVYSKNFWEVLGFFPDENGEYCYDETAIRKRYRSLALKYHPDKTDKDTNKEFGLLKDACDFLSIKENRDSYNPPVSIPENDHLYVCFAGDECKDNDENKLFSSDLDDLPIKLTDINISRLVKNAKYRKEDLKLENNILIALAYFKNPKYLHNFSDYDRLELLLIVMSSDYSNELEDSKFAKKILENVQYRTHFMRICQSKILMARKAFSHHVNLEYLSHFTLRELLSLSRHIYMVAQETIRKHAQEITFFEFRELCALHRNDSDLIEVYNNSYKDYGELLNNAFKKVTFELMFSTDFLSGEHKFKMDLKTKRNQCIKHSMDSLCEIPKEKILDLLKAVEHSLDSQSDKYEKEQDRKWLFINITALLLLKYYFDHIRNDDSLSRRVWELRIFDSICKLFDNLSSRKEDAHKYDLINPYDLFEFFVNNYNFNVEDFIKLLDTLDKAQWYRVEVRKKIVDLILGCKEESFDEGKETIFKSLILSSNREIIDYLKKEGQLQTEIIKALVGDEYFINTLLNKIFKGYRAIIEVFEKHELLLFVLLDTLPGFLNWCTPEEDMLQSALGDLAAYIDRHNLVSRIQEIPGIPDKLLHYNEKLELQNHPIYHSADEKESLALNDIDEKYPCDLNENEFDREEKELIQHIDELINLNFIQKTDCDTDAKKYIDKQKSEIHLDIINFLMSNKNEEKLSKFLKGCTCNQLKVISDAIAYVIDHACYDKVSREDIERIINRLANKDKENIRKFFEDYITGRLLQQFEKSTQSDLRSNQLVKRKILAYEGLEKTIDSFCKKYSDDMKNDDNTIETIKSFLKSSGIDNKTIELIERLKGIDIPVYFRIIKFIQDTFGNQLDEDTMRKLKESTSPYKIVMGFIDTISREKEFISGKKLINLLNIYANSRVKGQERILSKAINKLGLGTRLESARELEYILDRIRNGVEVTFKSVKIKPQDLAEQFINYFRRRFLSEEITLYMAIIDNESPKRLRSLFLQLPENAMQKYKDFINLFSRGEQEQEVNVFTVLVKHSLYNNDEVSQEKIIKYVMSPVDRYILLNPWCEKNQLSNSDFVTLMKKLVADYKIQLSSIIKENNYDDSKFIEAIFLGKNQLHDQDREQLLYKLEDKDIVSLLIWSLRNYISYPQEISVAKKMMSKIIHDNRFEKLFHGEDIKSFEALFKQNFDKASTLLKICCDDQNKISDDVSIFVEKVRKMSGSIELDFTTSLMRSQNQIFMRRSGRRRNPSLFSIAVQPNPPSELAKEESTQSLDPTYCQ